MNHSEPYETNMSYKLIVTKNAHSDIDDIVKYICGQLCSPKAANDLLDAIEESYSQISSNPFMYALCTDERLQKQKYRKVVIKHYILIYRIDESTKTVYVLRVFYGGRNYVEYI